MTHRSSTKLSNNKKKNSMTCNIFYKTKGISKP